MNFLSLVSRLRLRVFLSGCAGVLGLGTLCAAQDTAGPLFVLRDKALNELSGMTASRCNPGYFWAHNDSGDSARIFLVNAKGETRATVHLEGVIARDWEDMTSAGGFLYIGDIGDNFEVMESVKIHRIREPKLSVNTPANVKIPATQVETMTLRYPDGAHNAETLAATPDGRLLIVTKSKRGSSFYATKTPFQGGAGTLEKIGGPLKLGGAGQLTRLATSGEFSPNGKKLALCTYAQLYEFVLRAPFDASSLDLQNPKIQPLPPLKQCESAAYSPDGLQILVSSEWKNAPVYALNSRIK